MEDVEFEEISDFGGYLVKRVARYSDGTRQELVVTQEWAQDHPVVIKPNGAIIELPRDRDYYRGEVILICNAGLAAGVIHERFPHLELFWVIGWPLFLSALVMFIISFIKHQEVQ